MNSQFSTQIPSPNPITQAEHHRQVRWQILLPLILGGVIVIVLAVLATMGANPQVAQWGNISAVFLILPLLLVLLVTLVILSLLVYLMARLLKILPSYTRLAQMYIDQFGSVIKRVSDRIASPVITGGSVSAGIGKIFSRK